MTVTLEDDAGAIQGREVTVAPVATTLCGPLAVGNIETVGLALANDDGSQSLAAYVELGPTAAGPWFQSPWAAFEAIAAGATVSDVAQTHGHAWMRLRGTASGAGLDCRVWARRGRTFR